MKITFFGTRGGFPTDQQMISLLVEHRQTKLLLDAGSPRIFEQPDLIVKLCAIFISHLHSDHSIMLPHLLLARLKLTGEEYNPQNCPIFAPQNIEELMNSMDLASTLYSWAPTPPNQIGDVSIDFLYVKHARPTLAYKFSAIDSGTMIFTGDTSYFDELVDFCQAVDVLICECSYSRDNSEDAGRWQHMTTTDVANLVALANPHRVCLVHVLGLTPEEAAAEVRNQLPSGNSTEIIAGYDGLTLVN